MSNDKSAEEIVRGLRNRAHAFSTTPECDKVLMDDAADLIKSQAARITQIRSTMYEQADVIEALRTQLTASQQLEVAG